jgi:hypothetical protein
VEFEANAFRVPLYMGKQTKFPTDPAIHLEEQRREWFGRLAGLQN